MNQLSRVKRLKGFYNRYGWDGIKYLFKSVVKKEGVIEYTPKNYKHPIFIRSNTSDTATFAQIFQALEYDIDLGFTPEVIVDCGANVGFATVYFKNRFPNATIISVEPETSNYNMLVKNTERYNNIFCLKNGIWNKTTNLKITDSSHAKWSFTVEEVDFETEHTVKAISVKEIMKRYNLKKIDVLKIDIEGAEKNLFEQNYNEWLPYTKCIIIELHDWIQEGSSDMLYKALSNYKYRKFQQGENVICILEGK